MKQTIGIVGLGIMGHGMAVNFLKNGHTVYVWNRTTKTFDDLTGAVVCDSPESVARKADVIFEVTANDQSSKAVWTSDHGILAGADPSKVLIASATLSVGWVDELIRLCRSKQFMFMDAPLTGGRIGAETGTLTMLCGGSDELMNRLAPVFSSIATTVHQFGPVGSGIRYKLILNYMQATHVVAFGQAMKMAESQGLHLNKVSEALVERPGGVITSVAKRAYDTDPDPITFSIEWMVKDLTYAKQFAQGIDTSFLDEVLTIYKEANKRGFGKKDWARINKLL